MTDEIEAIRERHEKDCGFESEGMQIRHSFHLYHHSISAHTDRAALLAHVDRLVAELAEERAKISAWTDDDQRALNAAVADAMWHWDDMPMDCDDAISLTGILKSSLQDNGFQIVHLAAALAKDAP